MADEKKPQATQPSESNEAPKGTGRSAAPDPLPSWPEVQRAYQTRADFVRGLPPQNSINEPPASGDENMAALREVREAAAANARTVPQAVPEFSSAQGDSVARQTTSTMSEHPVSSGTPFTVFDYLGLGFILEPPGVLVHAVMTGEPLKWSNAIYALPFIAVGAVCIFIGRNWQTLKQKTNSKIVIAVDKLSRSYIVPFIVVLIVLGGIATLPILIWPPAVPIPANGFTQQQVDEKITIATVPLKSQIASLTQQLNEAQQRRSAVQSNSQQNSPAIPEPKLSTDDIATKISIWDSVLNSNLNSLISAYNSLDAAQARWSRMLDSAQSRGQLHNDIVNALGNYLKASTDLDILRSEYPNYHDVAAALAQPNTSELQKTAQNFANAVAAIPENAAPGFDVQLRPLAGALRREMDKTVAWFGGLRNIANRNREALRNLK